MSTRPTQDRENAEENWEVYQFLSGFALRFDGYKYAESRGSADLLAEWSGQFVATLQAADDPLQNFAAFFALQRFLCKWGGEMLSRESREHLAYRLLFLHLYRLEIPEEWLLDGGAYARDLDLTRLETVAARVRSQLIEQTLRHGNPLRPGL